MPSNPAKLRRLLQEPGILLAPGAYDGLSAKIIAKTGFKLLIMGGYSIAASRLAQPDFGILTLTEMVHALKTITDAIDIPVIADGDTGYGNPLHVQRTVHEYESMGAAAIILEDQVFPKRCGHMLGKEVLPAEQHIQKIRAACETRENPDLLIIARTDARATLGLHEAIERGRRYLDAGAEALFIEAPQSEAELAAIGKAFPDTILVANMVEGGKTPCLSGADLAEMGFKIVFWPCSAIYALSTALHQVFSTLLADGSTAACQDNMMSFHGFNQLVGLDLYQTMDQKYKT